MDRSIELRSRASEPPPIGSWRYWDGAARSHQPASCFCNPVDRLARRAAKAKFHSGILRNAIPPPYHTCSARTMYCVMLRPSRCISHSLHIYSRGCFIKSFLSYSYVSAGRKWNLRRTKNIWQKKYNFLNVTKDYKLWEREIAVTFNILFLSSDRSYNKIENSCIDKVKLCKTTCNLVNC